MASGAAQVSLASDVNARQRPQGQHSGFAWAGPVRVPLADARWHFQHGPIDLVLGAEGDPDTVAQAHEHCWQAFQPVLGVLAAERALLQQDLRLGPKPRGPVAGRMVRACKPYADDDIFITAMAAVAGSVADELIACYRIPGVTRAFINNGGDIALHLSPGQSYRVGVVGRDDAPSVDADLQVFDHDAIRGIATSGWRGRSFSLGIADSVTVLAHDAAAADAAATLIANEVNIAHPAIVRRPACELRDDCDLGERLVTVQVGPLPSDLVSAALDRGLACARRFQTQGRIAVAALSLAGQWRVAQPVAVQSLSCRWGHAA
jgi:uncharacterized protein